MKKILSFILSIIIMLLLLTQVSSAELSKVNLTRMECIQFIIDNSSIDYSSQDISFIKDFADADGLNEIDKKIICASIDKDIIKGYEDKTLRLDEKVTRAEFACMIYRAKDFYKPCTDIVSYNGNYKDLSDWNKNEIIYCIENGFLMGYGDSFGADDFITYEQMQFVGNRLKYGLSTKEKYSLMNVCGVCPIPYNKMIESAYNDEVSSQNLETGGLTEDVTTDKQTTANKILSLMDMLGNLDCDKLKDEDYEAYQRTDFTFQTPPIGEYVPYEIIFSDIRTDIELILSDAKNNNTKRESIHVLAPQNTFEGFLAAGYRIQKGCGYEYFMYTQGDNLPEGIELNTWYRRKFSVEFVKNNRIGQPHRLVIKYSNAQIFD